jgi:hypothetical protein
VVSSAPGTLAASGTAVIFSLPLLWADSIDSPASIAPTAVRTSTVSNFSIARLSALRT